MYRVIPDDLVDEQIEHLPHPALVAYAEVLAMVAVAPLAGRPYNEARPDAGMRQVVFGPAGEGLVVEWVG